MTTIAYREGVISGDTAIGNGSRDGNIRKISKNKAGDLAGASGTAIFVQAFLNWFDAGEKGIRPETGERCTGLIVRSSGDILVYEGNGYFQVEAPYFAIGSGAPEALGAMHAGATAEGAVRAAMAHDWNTAGNLVSLSLNKE